MDRKRIAGPELSVPPLFDKPQIVPQELAGEGRPDGRSPEDVRPIFLKTGLINQANGSAYIELGNTKLACAVYVLFFPTHCSSAFPRLITPPPRCSYGPRQNKKQTFSNMGLLNCEFKFASFSCSKRRGNQRDSQEKEYSQILSEALAPAVRLELFPKAMIDVFVTVLENDGTASCLAGAITAASVAIADAGLEMIDQVAAVSAVERSHHLVFPQRTQSFAKDQILMDATSAEEKLETGTLVVSYMPSANEVTHVLQTGETEGPVTVQAIEQCIDACSKIYTVMSAALVESLKEGERPRV
ncbi:ribosomal protein S5 domain 2-type protein [Jimgerdemannia flammicorona]|uniref:Ribosomal protein S5 domain 2-type protein n=1 Tax=Jimgerdemannia flammicorona TaxID=994334 RepID=A0A433Q456_9FUNG|nr:ribosomal protein S5 domain 2-type protein [Jimgerdemannia flammicorona]